MGHWAGWKTWRAKAAGCVCQDRLAQRLSGQDTQVLHDSGPLVVVQYFAVGGIAFAAVGVPLAGAGNGRVFAGVAATGCAGVVLPLVSSAGAGREPVQIRLAFGFHFCTGLDCLHLSLRAGPGGGVDCDLRDCLQADVDTAVYLLAACATALEESGAGVSVVSA